MGAKSVTIKLVSRFVQALLLVAVVAAIVLGYRAGGDGSLRPPDRRPALNPFRLESLGGEPWALADQRGSVVLLNFWATWCPPCRKETPDLVTLSHTYGMRGLRVAGITMDEEPASVVPAFVDRYRVPYPILVPDASFGLAHSINSLPTTMLLDRQGRVARMYFGARSAEEIAPDVERLLAEK
jgi:cytochrome c biogenesis protein CcmG/thiol:disulfide interchange protein DsbE